MDSFIMSLLFCVCLGCVMKGKQTCKCLFYFFFVPLKGVSHGQSEVLVIGCASQFNEKPNPHHLAASSVPFSTLHIAILLSLEIHRIAPDRGPKQRPSVNLWIGSKIKGQLTEAALIDLTLLAYVMLLIVYLYTFGIIKSNPWKTKKSCQLA